MKTFSITVDVEPDFGGRLNSFRGIEEGLPLLLKLLKHRNIKATFFVSGDILKNYPLAMKALDKVGHEIASHGIRHEKLRDMGLMDSMIFMRDTRSQFNEVGLDPVGFRAPYLMPNKHINIKDFGFDYDSSLTNAFFPGRYCGLHLPNKPFKKDNYIEFPVSRMKNSFSAFSLIQVRRTGKFYSELDHTTIFFHLHDLLKWKNLDHLPFYIKPFYKNDVSNFDILEMILDENKDKQFVTLKEKWKQIKQI